MVEVVYRFLQVEEETLLLRPLLRDVGDLPGKHRQPLAWHVEGTGPGTVPARAWLGPGLDRLGEPKFTVAGLAVAQAGRQPVDGHRGLGDIRKQPFDRLEVGRRSSTRHVGIGPVGVDDAALGIGDQETLRHRIDEGFRQLVAGGARSDLNEADRRREQKADADHGEHAQHAEQERIAEAFAEQPEDDRGAGQNDDEDDEPGDGARTRVLVDDRYWIEIAARFLGHVPPARDSDAPTPANGRLNHILL